MASLNRHNWLPIRERPVLGKRTILPILTLILNNRYLAEQIYSFYREYHINKALKWYMYISPFTQSMNLRGIFRINGGVIYDSYHKHEMVRLLQSIKIISHPDFISGTESSLIYDIPNLSIHNILTAIINNYEYEPPVSDAELLVNIERIKLSPFEKIKIYNYIIKEYSELVKILEESHRRKYEEMYDIPYDVPLYVCDIYKYIFSQFKDYQDIDLLLESGIIRDSNNYILTY